ncbi:MAG: chemotaxis protein methyltransferase CheR [Pseudonocardiales bacterium]|jgi:chemotaxis protein methyltransferase CheR|nr:chemotaxis protein methyltransferase CheR [Pseudonocardiales bacterium]
MNAGLGTEAVVDRVSQLLHDRIGLRPELSLRGRLRRCIRDDAAARKQDLDAYLDTLLDGDDALQGLLNRVTVQETAFFRHPEHFELLMRDLLAPRDGPLTIWSAGCANGQEAFSLAMLLEELDVDGSVIATDVSTDALLRTEAARYTERELGGLSPERRERHLTPDGGSWLVNRNLRARVRTLRYNLIDPIPTQIRGGQVIFCRNVLIYLSPEHAEAFLARVADAMPAASLFLGAAESIWQLSDRFETVRAGDTFSYRLRPAVVTSGQPTGAGGVATARPAARTRQAASTQYQQTSTGRRLEAEVPIGAFTVGLTATLESDDDVASALLLSRVGQQASAAGNAQGAVVAFRKCAYLTPSDPLAHLHLGLALETAGDHRYAQRAYAAARHALAQVDPAQVDLAAEGYTTSDLLQLLDAKQHGSRRANSDRQVQTS